jgi:hypothetical protein
MIGIVSFITNLFNYLPRCLDTFERVEQPSILWMNFLSYKQLKLYLISADELLRVSGAEGLVEEAALLLKRPFVGQICLEPVKADCAICPKAVPVHRAGEIPNLAFAELAQVGG